MDWKKLIQDLIDAGMTQVEIAAECEVAQSSVSALASGKSNSPRYEFGVRLESLRRAHLIGTATAAAAAPGEVAAVQGV